MTRRFVDRQRPRRGWRSPLLRFAAALPAAFGRRARHVPLGYQGPMQDKHREQRRAKRAEKSRKKRANASRPGVGGPVGAGFDPAKGRTWPTGDCYVSEDWEEPGAKVDLVFSRARDGSAVIAAFELDRSGPGLVASRAVGARQESVTGECARLSERSGKSMIGCAPGLVAALVADAREHGTGSAMVNRDALALLEGVPPLELPTPFGPAVTPVADAPTEGLLSGLRKRLFGG